jgi:uncharacterized membrane protein|tara:strand:- start:3568 stop:4842 length:1275 start_codon:yes stop_codon:yes gene_type:complete
MKTFNMKSKAIMVSFIALFAITFALSTVVAQGFVDITDVEFNGISMSLDNVVNAVAIDASESVPVEVKFNSLTDIEDVRVKVYIEGFKNDIEDETSRFHVLGIGNKYVKRFTLKMPSTEDFDDLSDDVTLLVRFSAKGETSFEETYALKVQRNLHSLNLLSIDLSDVVVAGNSVAVDVVIENNGYDRLDNVYVKASIPGLGVSRKVYAGDLAPTIDGFDDDINDAVVKRVYLTIPNNAAPGNYEIEVEAYNYDASITALGRVVIEDVQGGVLPSSTSKTISPGQESTFDLVLINPSNRMVVYNIMPEETKGVLVEISDPVVAVGADSSRTVQVKVRATENADEGTYIVTVNANTDTGVTKQVSFSVSVEEPSKVGITGNAMGTNNTVVLTVVLVIIFVVLLIVLIVLLSKRPAETEEFGETNYY